MITIKLSIQNKIDINDYLREFNSCMRFSYNRFVDGLNEKNIRHLLKSKNIFNSLSDTWFNQCAIKEGQSWFQKVPDGKLIFGGKKNLKLRSEGKISNEQWKELRLYPLCIQGEVQYKGNRKFELDIIENNQIIFKPKYGIKIIIELPKLRKNYKKKLFKLEELSKNCKVSFTIRLSNTDIFIIFDEKIFKQEQIQLNENRIFGIDLNPNYIGWSILEFNSKDQFQVLKTGVIENKELNQRLKVRANHPKQIHQNNKKNFEIFEISKFLISQALHFKCSKFSIEKLQIETKNHKKGKEFNRLINNYWNRNDLITNLRKRCNIYEIEFVEINPAYSSFIGNVLYGQKHPDMIASSIEISRRGFHKWQKNWFYPRLVTNKNLLNLWKEAKDFSYNNWKELFSVIKILKLNYRSSLEDFTFRVFSLNNIKSKVFLYSFS
jgi:IS605 OrfB family transposase